MGDTTPEPASQHLASDRKDWETQGDKRETTSEPASQHLASSDRRNWETQGDETGRHREASGRHDPGARVTARRDCETQGGKRETRPRSQRHSIWHLTAEAGRHRETSRKHERLRETSGRHNLGDRKTSGKQDPGTGVTLSHSLYLKLEPQYLAVWGKTIHNSEPLKLSNDSELEKTSTIEIDINKGGPTLHALESVEAISHLHLPVSLLQGIDQTNRSTL